MGFLTSTGPSKTIESYIKNVRFIALKRDAVKYSWLIYSLILFFFWFVITIEAQFYFSSSLRHAITRTILIGCSISLFLALLYILAILMNKVPRYKLSRLARVAGSLAFPKEDTIINALQLERSIGGSSSSELKQEFIAKTLQELNSLDIGSLFPERKIRGWKATSILMLILVSVTLIFRWEPAGGAVYRWAHQDMEFYSPPPFSMRSLSGDVHLLGGGTTALEIEVMDAQPDTVWLALTTPGSTPSDQDSTIVLSSTADMQGHFIFSLTQIHQDYDYRAFVPAQHFWEAWKEVTSPVYRILVTDRPTLDEFTITIHSPAYSGLAPVIQEENQASVQGLKGSTVQVDLKSNLPLEKALIHLQEKAVDMQISGTEATGQFPLEEEDEFLIRILDTRGIANNQPIPYHVNVIPDQVPQMNIIVPEDDIQIPGNQKLAFHLKIEDDFGFSNLQIGYEIHRPEFLQIEPFFAIYNIPGLDKTMPVQEIQTIWNLSGINLMPEDEIHFHFELYDNDDISGPKKSISRTFIARIPSLASLYDSFDKQENSLLEEISLNVEDIEALKKALNETELQLLKSEKLSWEDKLQVDRLFESAQEQIKEMKALEEAISQLTEMGEEQALFSKEVMEKFNTLRDLISQLLTEDMMPNLEEMQQAMEDMNVQDIQSAMEKMRNNLDRLEKELDRYIDVFKRVQAEQKMEELSNRLSQLIKHQSTLEEKIRKLDSSSDPQNMEQLAQEESWNLKEFDRLTDALKETGREVEEYSPSTTEALKDLANSDVVQNIESDLGRVIKELDRQNLEAGRQYSYSALENMDAMQKELSQIQENFRNETASEMAEKLKQIMRKALVVSKIQEELIKSSQNIPRNSPRFRGLAARQQMIQKQMTTLTQDLTDLSKKTFAVTPEIGKSLGVAFANMEAAKIALADRKGQQAAKSEQLALSALNSTIFLLNQSANSMQSSGSASGFEQFLQQMEAMSGQQQGINNESMQLSLGQMAAAMQQSMLGRLLSQQKQVKKSLEKLMEEMNQSGTNPLGDMGNIAGDMDEVIKDLSRGNLTQKTIDRQQQILSRMLDSQKSMTQRGEEEQRTSRQPDDYITGSGPGGLPEDLGQRQSMTMDALNRSLKAGYPKDYQDMIRRYFHSLAQSQLINNDQEENGDTLLIPIEESIDD